MKKGYWALIIIIILIVLFYLFNPFCDFNRIGSGYKPKGDCNTCGCGLFGKFGPQMCTLMECSRFPISDIFGDSYEILTVMPYEIDVDRGDSNKARIYIRNLGSETAKFTLKVEVTDALNEDAKRVVEKWLLYSSKEIILEADDVAESLLLVKPPKTAELGTYVIKITVSAPEAGIEESKEIIITIESG